MKQKNLNCIESSVRKEVVNQLALLRSEHKENCRKTKKRASDSWSSKIIHINLEIPLDLFLAPILFDDAYIFKLPDNDVPKLCMIADDNDDNTNDSLNIHFMKNSSAEIISENIVQVIIGKDLIRRIIPNNQFSDEKMIINFIRAIKNQLIELNISEDRISSSSIRRALMTNPDRESSYIDYALNYLFCSQADKFSYDDERLLENHYYKAFLSWKIQNYLSDSGYQELNRIEKKYQVKCPPFSTIKRLKNLYGNWIPLHTIENGCFMDVRHAILLLISLNRHILEDLKDKHVLHFRLCQDGTWIGRYLNCIASSLTWVDAGKQCQNALSLIPLSLVRVKKENRENIELALSIKFINTFQPGQVMEIFGVEYNINFSYSADYKMVSQLMGLAGPCSNHFCNWCKISRLKLLDSIDVEDKTDSLRTSKVKNAKTDEKEIETNSKDKKKNTVTKGGKKDEVIKKQENEEEKRMKDEEKEKKAQTEQLLSFIRNWSAFSEDRGARTVQEQNEILDSGDKQNYSYVRAPLYKNYFEYGQSFSAFAHFSIIFCCSYKNISADLLHMKLRIADILLKQAIKAACQLPVSSSITIDEAELQLKDAFTFLTEFSKETKTHIQTQLSHLREVWEVGNDAYNDYETSDDEDYDENGFGFNDIYNKSDEEIDLDDKYSQLPSQELDLIVSNDVKSTKSNDNCYSSNDSLSSIALSCDPITNSDNSSTPPGFSKNQLHWPVWSIENYNMTGRRMYPITLVAFENESTALCGQKVVSPYTKNKEQTHRKRLKV
ncbi:unnamed protein product [Didymodactylos carnosus]|uniref:Uncharacterized protein n=1 Tax=Didymodactylos carnosus TaxID=1234261 RepID=A0A8S2EEH4_9BILA|nr:unnamed protein product [Didymodactylos carnosus]CAF3909490.1 unnamed protein product [Didymodactylos carnosus]